MRKTLSFLTVIGLILLLTSCDINQTKNEAVLTDSTSLEEVVSEKTIEDDDIQEDTMPELPTESKSDPEKLLPEDIVTPQLIKEALTVDDFVPEGWAIFSQAEFDYNKDENIKR